MLDKEYVFDLVAGLGPGMLERGEEERSFATPGARQAGRFKSPRRWETGELIAVSHSYKLPSNYV